METQEKKYESTKKTEESERKNTMEKLQLFQSIVETHEKSMDKLREENLSLQKALDEVAKEWEAILNRVGKDNVRKAYAVGVAMEDNKL